MQDEPTPSQPVWPTTTTTGAAATVPEPAIVAAPAPQRPRARLWPVVAVAVVVSALVGAATSAAVVTALDDDRERPEARPSARSTPSSSPAAAPAPQDIQAVLGKVEPAVVAIRTETFRPGGILGGGGNGEGAGTGMILTPDGEVLTNAHVIDGATSIEVTLFGETEPRPADLVGSDPAADVALVKIRQVSGLPTVELGDSDGLRVGDSVIAIGNALALSGGPTVTTGIVSAKDRSLDGDLTGLIQTDAAINPGNSGGPLVDFGGRVVGMNTAVIQSSGQALAQNIGFAIAAESFEPIIERIRSGGAAVGSATFMGISAVTLTPELRERFGFEPESGAIIEEVVVGSPAENAGIRRADVVVAFGGTPVTSAEDLVEAIRERKPGDTVEVRAFRGGNERTFSVVLGSRAVGNQ